jgi:hypothetical protein
MVNAVAQYRVYVLGPEGRVMGAVQFVCPDDDTAKEYSKQLADRDFVELWRDKRRLAKFDPKQ